MAVLLVMGSSQGLCLNHLPHQTIQLFKENNTAA